MRHCTCTELVAIIVNFVGDFSAQCTSQSVLQQRSGYVNPATRTNFTVVCPRSQVLQFDELLCLRKTTFPFLGWELRILSLTEMSGTIQV